MVLPRLLSDLQRRGTAVHLLLARSAARRRLPRRHRRPRQVCRAPMPTAFVRRSTRPASRIPAFSTLWHRRQQRSPCDPFPQATSESALDQGRAAIVTTLTQNYSAAARRTRASSTSITSAAPLSLPGSNRTIPNIWAPARTPDALYGSGQRGHAFPRQRSQRHHRFRRQPSRVVDPAVLPPWNRMPGCPAFPCAALKSWALRSVSTPAPG